MQIAFATIIFALNGLIIKEMATVMLEFDGRNKLALKALDFILSLGLFKVKKTTTGIDEAIEDIKKGRVYTAKNVDDMFQKILG